MFAVQQLRHAGQRIISTRGPMMFSTTAAGPIVTRPILERLPDHSVLIDIAPPPGSVDFETARSLGHTAVWARGLGSRAPVTVGASQWYGLRRRIEHRVHRHLSTPEVARS